jgi:hypothetical protein
MALLALAQQMSGGVHAATAQRAQLVVGSQRVP